MEASGGAQVIVLLHALHLRRYFQYKQLWDVFKLPGEADRKALRLEIKVTHTHT